MSKDKIKKAQKELSEQFQSILKTKSDIENLQRILNAKLVSFYKKEEYIEQLNKK